jgi:plastocyanin
MKAIALAAAVVLALVVSQAAPASTSGTAVASKGSVTVDINHFKFHPPTLSIKKGTTVVFSNSAAIAHTATHTGLFDTGHIKPGRSVSVRFTQKGTFPYHCKIHPFMHGKIVVG